ncbi:hypothetical protein LCGC14_2488100, partial [marine sediment metagenome]
MSGIKGVDIIELAGISGITAGVWIEFGVGWAAIAVGAMMLTAAVVYRIFRSPA